MVTRQTTTTRTSRTAGRTTTAPIKRRTIPKSFVTRVQKWNTCSKKLAREAESIKREAARRGINVGIVAAKRK